MTTESDPDKSHFLESARACLANGKRLLDESEWLEYREPPSTSFALAVIAQEEFAKGFLLHLVSRGTVPWNSLLYRATRDHTCKQLLAVVMEHMSPDIDEYLRRMGEWNSQHTEKMSLLKSLETTENADERQQIWNRIHEIDRQQESFPPTVADAMYILRHEKIGRWQDSKWQWVEEPEYDEVAQQLAGGKLDRQKQDALYVRLNKDGTFNQSIPNITTDLAKQTRENTQRLGGLLERLVEGEADSLVEYEKIESAFKTLFATLNTESEEKKNDKP